jgi:hypothetical protein
MNSIRYPAMVLVMTAMLTPACRGDEGKPKPLMEVTWRSLEREGRLIGGEIVSSGGEQGDVLRVKGADDSAAQGILNVIKLAEIQPPEIKTQAYLLSGQVRYQDVEGIGFLEMWSHFPDGSAFFTRTLGTGGTMGRLQGSSDWRTVQLPFSLGDDRSAPRPNKLVVNVVLPGKGTVWLSGLMLTEVDSSAGAARPGAWWSNAVGGWIGGILGTFLGLAGAVAGFLSSRGIGRNSVFVGTILGIALGANLAGSGLVALLLQQPPTVFYPLLLVGGLYLVLCTGGLFLFQKRYDQTERRRMDALDVAG